MAVIEVKNVSKVFRVLKKKPGLYGFIKAFFRSRYRYIKAVDNINFNIEQGELIGYIGANGAGKSTTVKLLSGIIEPTEGSVKVLGRNPCRERIANSKDIGVVFGQKTQLWWDLPVIESFNLLQKIYEVPYNKYKNYLEEIIEVFEIKDILGQPVRQLSLGQKMKCDLAAPFLHEPKIVYLDEPTIGLDVAVKAKIRTFLKEQCAKKNITLFLTTHDLKDIEEISERVILIDHGKKLYDGDVLQLRKKLGERRVLFLELKEPFDSSLIRDKYSLQQNNITIETKDYSARIKFNPFEITGRELLEFILSAYDVIDFSLEDVHIEEIVRKVFSKEYNENQ